MRHFTGVTKCRNRWQARIRHPKSKRLINLGCYDTSEEATAVVEKKRAEYEKIFQDDGSENVETCKKDLEGMELPPGVSRRGRRRFGARIWHPELKVNVSLGLYSSPEEAAAVIEEKRVHFENIYGCNNGGVDKECDDIGDALESPEEDVLLVNEKRTRTENADHFNCDGAADILDKHGSGSLSTSECLKEDDIGNCIDSTKEGGMTCTKRKVSTAGNNCNKAKGVRSQEGSGSKNMVRPDGKRDNKPHQVESVCLSESEHESEFVNGESLHEANSESNKSEEILLEERIKDKVNAEVESSESVSKGRQLFRGVSKTGNGWQARVFHPMLKFDIYLGFYQSPQEASAVVEKKKAEFDKLKGDVENSGDDPEEMKLPPNVYRRGFGRWMARIWHPELKCSVSLGSYGSPEEAAAAVNKQKILFQKTHGCKIGIRGRTKRRTGFDKGFKPSKCANVEVIYTCETPGNGSTNSVSNEENSNPTTLNELLNRGTVDAADKPQSGVAHDPPAFLNAESSDICETPECQFGYGSTISALNTENPYPTTVREESNCGTVDLADKPQSGVAHNPPTFLDAGSSDSAHYSERSETSYENPKTSLAYNFLEAPTIGFINEYGQLIGEYSKLDEMWLSLPDEVFEAT